MGASADRGWFSVRFAARENGNVRPYIPVFCVYLPWIDFGLVVGLGRVESFSQQKPGAVGVPPAKT